MGKRLKKAEWEIVEEDENFVRITFLSHFSRGTIILKESYYKYKEEWIEKKLRGLTYYTDYDYIPTLEEFIDMDAQIIHLKNRILYYENRAKRELDMEEKQEITKSINNMYDSMGRRIAELESEYKEWKEKQI